MALQNDFHGNLDLACSMLGRSKTNISQMVVVWWWFTMVENKKNILNNCKVGGGFKYVLFLCSPRGAKMIQVEEHIFQAGWIHQPGFFWDVFFPPRRNIHVILDLSEVIFGFYHNIQITIKPPFGRCFFSNFPKHCKQIQATEMLTYAVLSQHFNRRTSEKTSHENPHEQWKRGP